MVDAASCTIYIKGVPLETTEADVRTACSKYGDITDVAIPEGKDFCFVEFAEEAQAKAAAETGEFEVAGQQASAEMRKPRRGRRERPTVPEGTSTSIYIPGLPDSAVKETIRSLFVDIADVNRVEVRQRPDGSRYSFVEFGSCQHVQDILAGGPYTLDDMKLEIEERKSVARPHHGTRDRNNGAGNSYGSGGVENDTGAGTQEGGSFGGGGGGGGGRGSRGGRRVPPVPENSVYIKGFPETISESDISAEFSQYGDIVSVILRVKHIGDDTRTWAFVEYEGEEAVAAAIEGSHELQMGDLPCTVEARKSMPTPRNEFGGRGRRYSRRARGDRKRDIISS